MRAFFLWWGLLLCSMTWVGAQISVEIVLDQEQFLRDESLPIKVRITNLSGQAIELGKDPDWLSFQVQNQEGRAISRLAQVPVQEAYTLQSAKTVMRRIDLLPYFDVSRPGRYTVAATVKIKNWDKEFTSSTKTFEISSGFKLWEQEFGVPGSNGPPEVRKYMLLQAHYLKQLMLYLRLADALDSRVYRVFPIGPLVSFSRPEAQLDKESNLHVLSQVGASSFIYMVVNPQGAVLIRQRYEYTDTRPVLRPWNEGKIVVSGGVRRRTADDLPAKVPETSTNDSTGPKP